MASTGVGMQGVIKTIDFKEGERQNRYEWFFSHVPRAGGHCIKAICEENAYQMDHIADGNLEEAFERKYPEYKNEEHFVADHIPLEQQEMLYPGSVTDNDRPIYAMVRNPYDRAVSMIRFLAYWWFRDKAMFPDRRYSAHTMVNMVALMRPQHEFIFYKNKQIAQFQKLEDDKPFTWGDIEFDLSKHNKVWSHEDIVKSSMYPMTPLESFEPNQTLIDIVNFEYEKDFELLGYDVRSKA